MFQEACQEILLILLELFRKTFKNFETYLFGSKKLCRKLVSSSESPIIFEKKFSVSVCLVTFV